MIKLICLFLLSMGLGNWYANIIESKEKLDLFAVLIGFFTYAIPLLYIYILNN